MSVTVDTSTVVALPPVATLADLAIAVDDALRHGVPSAAMVGSDRGPLARLTFHWTTTPAAPRPRGLRARLAGWLA